MRRILRVKGIMALALALVTVPQSAAESKPKRLMPFLCRDAVVRESSERVTLVGRKLKADTTVIVGRSMPGPRQEFENEQIRRAANLLAEYVEKITGVKCPVVSDPAMASQCSGHRIFVGADEGAAETLPELRRADAHGFVLATRPGANGMDLHIVGASGTGTLYGTWFFLMNYADVRVVMPGEIGEVYPKLDGLEIPKELYVFNPRPDFLLRIWSGESGFDRFALLADTPSTQRFQYHHNMFKIYDPTAFGETNPEFFPVFRGKRFIPDPKERAHWQPTFSEPRVADRAVAYANQLFTNRPDMKTVSLTVNDGGGYSELDWKDLPDGIKGIHNVYYRFVNAVARRIKDRWPDKFVTFLPYAAVRTPPDFALEDNTMMFIFSKTGNPKQVYEAWQDKVKHIGVYQWLYGMGWVIPNHWPHGVRDYLQWVHAQGGKALKGEAYVAWAQAGPKMWVLNNLLWNVDADVDALLKDFYEHAYGREAAPAMARYFAKVEEVYERRRTPTEYNLCRWRPGAYQFQYAKPEDFNLMAAALDEADRTAQGEANRTRVDMVARCFQWGRCYWDQYCAHEHFQGLNSEEVTTDTEAQALIDGAAAFYTAQERRNAYSDRFIEPLPQYCVPSKYRDNVEKWWKVDPNFRWDLDTLLDRPEEGFAASVGKAFTAITALKKKTMSDREAAEFWSTVRKQHPLLEPFVEEQRLMLLHASGELQNLLSNGSFEQPADPGDSEQQRILKALQSTEIRYCDFGAYAVEGAICKDWYIYQKWVSDASVSLDREIAHSGKVSLTAKGRSEHSGVIRNVRIPRNRGRYRLSFWYRTSEEAQSSFCGMMFYGIKNLPRIVVPIPRSGTWREFEMVFALNYPEGKQADCTLVLCLQRGKSDDSQIWFDDVRLELLSPEGVEER